jgi:acyl-CoA synthetase (AMP-forming)/AMP-acid ligase II
VSVIDLLDGLVTTHSEAVALAVVGGQALTYAAWWNGAFPVRTSLQRAGVRPGDRVVLAYDNDTWIDYATAYMGTLLAGATAVPLRSGARARWADRVVAASRARFVAFGPRGDVRTAREAVRRWPQVTAIELAGAPEGGAPAAPPGAWSIDPAGIAELLFTSGTTGSPRGVACSHEQLTFEARERAAARYAEVGRQTQLHATAFGSNYNQELLRAALTWRSTVVVLPVFSARACLRAVDEHAVDVLRLTPPMAAALCRLGRSSARPLARVREIWVSSAPCPAAVLDGLQALAPGTYVMNQYALTESGSARIKSVVGQDPAGSLGRPTAGTEVRVVDSRGRSLPPGAAGNICLRHVAAPRRRYWDDASAGADDGDATRFVDDWLWTGDLGYVDERGYVYLVDRLKDLIVVGGYKVAPVEVEQVILEHPGVTDAAVAPVPHPSLGAIVGALIVAERSLEPADILRHCASRMEWYSVPRVVVFGETIPRSAAGKTLRTDVSRALAAAASTPRSAGTSGRTDELVSMCREAIGSADIKSSDAIIAAGGDSLSIVAIADMVRARWGVDLPLEVLFSPSSIDEIAQLVDTLSDG